LIAIEKGTRIKPKELQNLVELPQFAKECWHFFLSLNSTRNSGFGISPITYQEILSYFTLYGIEPETWEVDMIKLFDSIAMDHAQKEQENKKKK
jgi:hypothetical protein